MARKKKQSDSPVIHKTIKIPESLYVKIEAKSIKQRWSFHKTMLILLEEAV